MYWYKVKNVLIILFAVINVFLVAVIIINKVNKNAEYKAITESLSNVLEKNGIGIDKSKIPFERPKLANVSIENAADLLIKNPGLILDEAPLFAKDDKGDYLVSGTKTLRVMGGRFYYKDSAVMPLQILSQKHTVKAEDLLSDMGFYTENLRPAISGEKIIFSYYIKGYQLFVYNIVVTMSEDKIATADGYFLKISKSTAQAKEVRSANDILMDFLKDEDRPKTPVAITKIYIGYSVLLDEGFVNFISADAVPTYRIITSDNKSFYYDGRIIK